MKILVPKAFQTYWESVWGEFYDLQVNILFYSFVSRYVVLGWFFKSCIYIICFSIFKPIYLTIFHKASL